MNKITTYSCLLLLMFLFNAFAFKTFSQIDSAMLKHINVDTLQKKGISEQFNDSLKQNNGVERLILPENFQNKISASSIKKIPAVAVGEVKNSTLGAAKNVLQPRKIPKNIFSILNQNSSHGTISAGYDYGVVPYVSNGPVPSGYFKMEGNMSMRLLSLPFNASFFYSDMQSVTGFRNYFRVVYDQAKFKQEINEKITAQTEALKNQLTSVYSDKQLTTQKLYRLRSLQAKGNFNMPDVTEGLLPDSPLDKLSIPQTSDELSKLKENALNYKGSIPGKLPDLLTTSLPIDIQKQEEARQKLQAKIQRSDSIRNEITKYESQLKDQESKIKDLNTSLENLKDPTNLKKNYSKKNTYLGKAMSVFNNVKKLEIGMCYPNYSTFLVNGIAIKGVNVEYQKKEFYLAFTHGRTINNFLTTNNAVQNQLINVQNLFNFFDFNDVKDSRKITSVKFGYGKKEENHLYAGFLFGLGMQNYLSNTTTGVKNNIELDKNYVAEVDGKYVINKNSNLDLVYGRSFLQTNNQYFNDGESGINSLFNTRQSNAVMGKYSLFIPKTKTKLSASGRWIDPFFKSYGVGFMRSDNFRYEIKAEQPLNRKIKVTAFYRRDEDNLLSLYNYKTVLQTIGSSITVKVKKSLSFRLGFNPVIQRVNTNDNSYSAKNVNSISNVIVTYNPTLRKGSSTFNFMYNYYYLTTALQTSTFENITFTNLTQLVKPFKNNFTASWFRSNTGDTLGNRTWMFTDELGYTFKKAGNVTGGLKAAYNPATGWQYGYLVKGFFPIVNHVSFELSAEKLVTGDFYNSLNYDQINKFPYLCTSKLVVNW